MKNKIGYLILLNVVFVLLLFAFFGVLFTFSSSGTMLLPFIGHEIQGITAFFVVSNAVILIMMFVCNYYVFIKDKEISSLSKHLRFDLTIGMSLLYFLSSVLSYGKFDNSYYINFFNIFRSNPNKLVFEITHLVMFFLLLLSLLTLITFHFMKSNKEE